MATLIYEPFDVTRVTPNPAVKKAQFGDGYSQRMPNSINNVRETWDLLWETQTDARAQALVDFFDQNQALAIEWVPPNELTARKFVCVRYSRDYNHYTLVETVSATLQEVFE